jgi:hypothetical protein
MFERKVQDLDPGMTGRLRAARRDALAPEGGARPPSDVLSRRWWLPAGLAAGLMLALGIGLPRAPAPTVAAEDPLDVALYAEDPAIYDWLADAPVANGDNGEGLH